MNKDPQRAPLENGLKRALAGKGGHAEPMFAMSGPPNGQKTGDPEASDTEGPDTEDNNPQDNNPQDNNPEQPFLTQGQELALAALFTCPTVRAASAWSPCTS